MNKLSEKQNFLGDNNSIYPWKTSLIAPTLESALRYLEAKEIINSFTNSERSVASSYEKDGGLSVAKNAEHLIATSYEKGIGLSVTKNLERLTAAYVAKNNSANITKTLEAIESITAKLERNKFIATYSMPKISFDFPKSLLALNFNPLSFGTLGSIDRRRNIQRVNEHLKLYNYEEEDIQTVEEPIENYNSIIKLDETIKVQGLIKSIYDDNEEIYKIKPRDFEEIVAEMLRQKGFNVELTKQTRDGGKDIIALHNTNGLGINRYLIECKRYRSDRPVGVGVVKQLCYTVQKEGANKGIIFTSSYFTRDAVKERESQKYLLDLKNGSEIIDWIREYIQKKK